MAKENYILPQLEDLSSTAKSNNPFVEDTRGFINSENIGVIQAISARNMQRINSRVPPIKGHGRWLWLGSAILLITSLVLFLGFSNIKQKDLKQTYKAQNIAPLEYQNNYTISMSQDFDDRFRPNYNKTETSGKQVFHADEKAVEDQVKDPINNETNLLDEQSDNSQEENPYADDNENYQPLSGEKFKDKHSSSLDRDARIPLKFVKAVVAKQENYYVFSEGKSFSYTMSEMPQYRGGKSKIESDLHANLSKVNYPGSFDKKVNAVLTFVVDSRGKVKDIKVIGAANAQIKTEIIRAVNKLSTWSKSSKSGKKGSLYYEIMLSFH